MSTITSKVLSEFYKGLLLKETLRPDLYLANENSTISGEMAEFVLTQVLPYGGAPTGDGASGVYDTDRKAAVQQQFKLVTGCSLTDAAAENLLRAEEAGIKPSPQLVKGSSAVMKLLAGFMWVLSGLADWTGLQTLDLQDVHTATMIVLVGLEDKSAKLLVGREQAVDQRLKDEMYDIFMRNGLFVSNPVLSKLSSTILNILADDAVAEEAFKGCALLAGL